MEKPESFTKLVSRIEGIITDYNTNNYSPRQVLLLSKKLSGYLTFFVKYLAESKVEHTKLYFIRKIKTERSKQNIVNQQLKVNQKVNISQAENEAKVLHEQDWKAEIEAEGISYECEVLVRQGNKVLDLMKAEIYLAGQEMKNL